MSFKWTDEVKETAVAAYLEHSPTEDNSMEIVKEMAKDMGCTANGLRTILSKAKVYIKVKAAKPATKAKEGSGSTRVTKADALNTLHEAISSLGLSPNEEIVSKLTGKAALYFAEVINSTKTEEE